MGKQSAANGRGGVPIHARNTCKPTCVIHQFSTNERANDDSIPNKYVPELSFTLLPRFSHKKFTAQKTNVQEIHILRGLEYVHPEEGRINVSRP